MTTYNTGNPIGSKDPRDLYDNAENLDTAVNDTSRDTWSDRLGRSRKTMSGMERQFDAAEDYRETTFVSTQADRDARFNDFIASSGYQFLGDYAAGIEITEYNQIIRDSDGEFWRLSGQVELPYVTTGAGIPEGDALVPAGDAVLRQELAGAGGAALVGYTQIAEDGATTNLREKMRSLGVITPVDVMAPEGGVLDATSSLQKALDSLPVGGTLDLLGGVFRLSKGAAHPAYPGNDQPCLIVYQKKGVTIRNGTLLVPDHAMSALDLVECVGCVVDNVTCVGAGNFPPLDGVTGRGEKGNWLSGEGDFTTKPHSDFEGYFDRGLHWGAVSRNNSVDSSTFSTGGFGGNFPQWGGGTASTWGMWNGGYIGNFGSGIAFIDCTNSIADSCNVSLFNGSGVYIRGGVSTHVKNCHIHGNYIGGVEVFASSPEQADFVAVTNNIIENNGHPQASTLHNHIDPGYGFSINNGTNPPRKAEVKGNIFRGNKRKGVDAHTFDNILVEGNDISTTGYGVQLTNNSGFVGGSAIITGNTIRDIDYGKADKGQGISFSSSEGDVIISNNRLTGIGRTESLDDFPPYGISISAANTAVIEGNTIMTSADTAAAVAISVGQAGSVVVRSSTISSNIIRGSFLFGILGAANTSSASYADGNLIDLENIDGVEQVGLSGSYESTGRNLINIPRDESRNKFYRNSQAYRLHATISFPDLTVTNVSLDGVRLSQPIECTASSIPQGFVLHIDPRLNVINKDLHVRFLSTRITTGNEDDPFVDRIVYRTINTPNSTISFTMASIFSNKVYSGSAVEGSIDVSMDL